MFLIKAASTVVWAAFLSAEMTVALGASPSNMASSVPFFTSFALAKNLSSIAATLTPVIGTLVEVAITYLWFTRRRGTPFNL